MQGSINRAWLIVYSLIIFTLAAVLPMFRLSLPVGNPDFGSTPVTVAGATMPWPIGLIAGLIKGIAATLWGGNLFIELPGGVGDALAAIFSAFLVKRWRRSCSVIAGQVSRVVFTAGMIAVTVGVLVAAGTLSPGLSPIGNLTSSAWQNILIVWKAVSYPDLVISIAVNIIASLLVVWLFGEIIDITLYRDSRVN